jgi:hypothetical protein
VNEEQGVLRRSHILQAGADLTDKQRCSELFVANRAS